MCFFVLEFCFVDGTLLNIYAFFCRASFQRNKLWLMTQITNYGNISVYDDSFNSKQIRIIKSMQIMSDYYIGLMSGTSLDSIDAVLMEKHPARVCFLYSCSHPLPDKLRQELLELALPGNNEIEKLADVEPAFALESARAVNHLLELANIEASEIKAIGSHGQTIRHRPEKSFTLQIGDPSRIAELTNITVVSDFRRRDMAANGQGAPLVPAFHKAAFASPDENRVIVNIGGISNISILSNQQPVSGFDTGPGNILMDYWCRKHRQTAYDQNGDWAASASFDLKLLNDLLKESYFRQAPPKSTGRELFNGEWLERKLKSYSSLEPEVVQATLCQLTAHCIVAAILDFAPETDAIYISGGGAHNTTLLRAIQAGLQNRKVRKVDELGIGADWVEAVAFAWLAQQTINRQTGSLPEVTGAKGPRILGAIYPA